MAPKLSNPYSLNGLKENAIVQLLQAHKRENILWHCLTVQMFMTRRLLSNLDSIPLCFKLDYIRKSKPMRRACLVVFEEYSVPDKHIAE